MIRSLSIALGLTLLTAAPASAEQVEVTAQATAAKAEFLRTATPPGPAASICLVDTGVTPNPDTTGVIDRVALQGDASDQGRTFHGTRMAMYIGAPSNGWGMVGFWPAARIVSIRANVAGEDAFTPAGYNFGLKQCDKDATFYGIKVAVLALSSETQLTADENEALGGTIAAAREHGLSVVVAAGNNDGRPPGIPASFPGALSVAASDSGSGALCSFSATGAGLTAPGCRLDGVDPVTGLPTTGDQGTSQAAAIVAAALAALRSWRPDLTPDGADRLLLETASHSAGGSVLDVSAAFTAAGLGAMVPPPAATPPPSVSPSPTPASSPQPVAVGKSHLPKPRMTVRTRVSGSKRSLDVRATNRPKGTRMTVRVYVRGRGAKLKRVALRTRSSSTIRIRVRTWRRVAVSFSDPSGRFLASPSATVNARR